MNIENPKLVAVVSVCYGQRFEIPMHVNSFLCQTNQNYNLYLVHDGPSEQFDKIKEQYKEHKNIFFINTPERKNDWGHSSRKWMLERLQLNEAKYLLITNADNYYMPKLIESINEEERVDLITFNCVYTRPIHCSITSHGHILKHRVNHQYDILEPKLVVNHIDMGQFIIDLNKAKEIGFNSTSFAADWEYLEEFLKRNPNYSYKHINKTLFVHN